MFKKKKKKFPRSLTPMKTAVILTAESLPQISEHTPIV